MHLFDKLRASLRRKSHNNELTLSQQIENLLNQSHVSQGDHRLLLLRLVYEHRSRQFALLNVPSNDSKRLEFERSMLKSLLAITSTSSTTPVIEKSQSNFQRVSRLYKSMPMATSDLPIIIVEFGQQRRRLKLNKFYLTINELLELFSELFHIVFDMKKYEILLFDKRLDSITNLDFTQLDNYSRFKIQLNRNQTTKSFDSYSSSMISDRDDITSLKQRLNTASMEIIEIAFLINSIHTNYKNLIKTLTDEDSHSNNRVHQSNQDLIVPPGFKPLVNHRSIIEQQELNKSSQDSQSTDEGIDRDAGSVSIFESAHSDYELESIYVECREDLTIINEPNRIVNNNNNQLEWRNQPYRPRPHWNSNQVKYQSNYHKDQFNDKPRLKKSINPNKAPLPVEKKKNIPCKYAAGGNCKRGSQCRFIHVV